MRKKSNCLPPMVTLIEINRNLIERIAQASSGKTTNAEILDWTNQVKTKPQTDE